METQDKDAAMHHYLSPLTDRTNQLILEGYTCQFKFEDEKLKCLDDGAIFTPDQVKIAKHFRFEGSSDPGDMTILYALETFDNHKGIVVDGYGTYSEEELGSFMKKVEEYENKNNPKRNPQ